MLALKSTTAILPTRSMSSTVVSGTGAQHVTLVRDLKLTNNYKGVTTLRKCIKPHSTVNTVCRLWGTLSKASGNVSGPNRNETDQTWQPPSTAIISKNHSILETLSLGVALTWSVSTWRGSDSIITTLPHCTRGHPTFIYQPPNPCDITPYFGITKCTVLLTSDLFHPVLPYRCGNKLVFPLCHTCAEENIDRPLLDKTWICDHTSERQLTGTWCTPVSRKLWTKSTPYKKFTKSGTSNTHATICLRNMSTHGSRSKKKPVAFLLIALLTNIVNMLQITKLMKAFTPI